MLVGDMVLKLALRVQLFLSEVFPNILNMCVAIMACVWRVSYFAKLAFLK